LNADTIREMHRAFHEGGREAINKVMRDQPAVFLKLLVLLVPREMSVQHKSSLKTMTDEQLEQGIEAIKAMLAAREAGEGAKVIEAVPDPKGVPALPAPQSSFPPAHKTRMRSIEVDGRDEPADVDGQR
jgi:hypothetical protein